MPAIARSVVCLLLVWLGARSADSDHVSVMVRELSGALEEGNAARFLDQVDHRRFREYTTLENYVVALVAQNEIGSSVGVIEQTKDGDGYEVKLDWMLQLRHLSGGTPARQRHGEVTCRIEPAGKRWKVTRIAPVSFFSPR